MKKLIIGWGKSGQSAYRWLTERGYKVWVFDDNKKLPEEIAYHNEPLEEFDQVIVSPGILFTHPLVQKAQKKELSIISEVELALSEIKNPLIAITGTNGKTTTSFLLHHIFNCAHIPSKVVGNSGHPLTSYQGSKKEILIVELSSFQLQATYTPAFSYGAILNISANHLDHHRSYKEYVEAKLHLFHLVKDKLFVPKKLKKSFFSTDEKVSAFPKTKTFSSIIAEENIQAALCLSKQYGVYSNLAHKAIATFSHLPHRLEYIGSKEGISWYNDSKATTPTAVLHAVQKFSSPIVLLVGGMDKGISFSVWKKELPKEIKIIIAFGFAAQKIIKTLESKFGVDEAKSLAEAVELAKKWANPGDTILLSPGCASFDEFVDYEERGNIFKQLVGHLGER